MNETNLLLKFNLNPVKLQDSGNVKDIIPFQRSLEKSRLEEIENIVKSITEIRRNLESIKTDVYNHARNGHDSDYFRKKMFDLENKISDVKEVMKDELMRLSNEEISLSKELNFFEKKLEEWSKPVNSQIFKPLRHSAYRIRNENNNNPVFEFQKFLSTTGGHYGGWEEQDHLIFLRERNKNKGNIKFLSVIHSLLQDFSYNDIEQHEEWYKKYEQLKNSQKEAIQKWKTEKLMQQNQKVENVEEKKPTDSTKNTLHQRNIAERIKEWKKRQELSKAEEEKRKKEEEERQKEERRKFKEMLKLKKMAVEKYKADKLKKLKAEVLGEQENKQRQSKVERNILLKAFRLQDSKFIERKRTLRLQTEAKARERIEKVRLAKPALDIVLRRDPKRVLQPTVIWNQHCQPSQEEKMDPIFDLNSIPRLAVPEWRRGLK